MIYGERPTDLIDLINDCNTFQVLLKSNLINYLTGVSYYQYSFELSKMWTILDKSSWCSIPVSYVGRHRDLQIILYLFSRVGIELIDSGSALTL